MYRKMLCLRNENKKPPSSAYTPFKYLVPSLEQMASVELVISLFYRSISENYPLYDMADLEPMREEVYKIVTQLSIAKSYKEKLYFWIAQIEDEMLRSCRHFAVIKGTLLKDDLRDLDYMIWTSRGCVDYYKTAEIMESNEYKGSTDMKRRLARSYSLRPYSNTCAYSFEGWFYMNERAFNDNDVVSHFWGSVDEQRLQMLSLWFQTSRFRFTEEYLFVKQHYCFILSRLTEKALKMAFTQLGWDILVIFLQDLLHKDYYLQIVSLMKTYNIPLVFHKESWFELCKSKITATDSTYGPLCGELYTLFPGSVTKSLRTASSHLEHFDWVIFFDLLKSVISRLNVNDRRKLLESYEDTAVSLLKKNQFQLFKTLVEICLPMEEDVVKFKDKIIQEQRINIVTDYCCNSNLLQLEAFLKWILGNDELKLKQFKQDVILDSFSLTLSHIRLPYVEDFRESNEGEIPSPDFTAMDFLLKWCFPCTKEIVNFKAYLVRNMVFTCGSGRILRPSVDIFEKKFKSWLFEYDVEKISHFNFRSNFSCISKMFISDIRTIVSADMMKNFDYSSRPK